MKEKIIELLNSTNINDQVLGIRIMVENSLTSEIFYEDDCLDIYDIEIKLNQQNKVGGTVIIDSQIFRIALNNFIARVDSSRYHDNYLHVRNMLEEVLYNDDSVDLNQFY